MVCAVVLCVVSQGFPSEEPICVGNGGLTSSHFVQCGVISYAVVDSFHHYPFGYQQELIVDEPD